MSLKTLVTTSFELHWIKPLF